MNDEFEADDFEAEVIKEIIRLASSIGWGFAYQDDDDEGMDHLIVGLVPALVEIDRTMDVYEIYEPRDSEENEARH